VKTTYQPTVANIAKCPWLDIELEYKEKDNKMNKLGFEITMLDEKTFEEIMSTVAFSREEAQVIIDNVREIPGMFPMVVYGMYPEK
jgi:hypothetical protein